MNNPIKKVKDNVKNFVVDHQEAIAVTAYAVWIAGCAVAGYKIAKAIETKQLAYTNYVVDNELLRQGVIAGHEFKYVPETQLLWDVTVRPDMK